jgi:hypothetical protein
MLPLTLLASNKLLNLLTVNDALSQAVNASAAAAGIQIVSLNTAQIFSSSLSADLADMDLQRLYPRVSIYSGQIVNSQREKFRAFSGIAALSAEVWSSASLEQQTEMGLHFYVDGIANLLRANIGDWGDGFRYSGIYEVTMQTPKAGGLGFVQSGRVTCNLEVSFN